MANAYSTLHNFDQPVYSRDFNYVNAALSSKQEGYNKAKGDLQAMYNNFSALRVKKGVDQKYIEDRLQQVKTIINKYTGDMDISDPNFQASLKANMTQILDDKTKTAILSTRRFEAEDRAWQKLQAEKPDKYSQLNHQYSIAKSDRERYLNSEEAGDMYAGGANTIEFQDLSKKIMDNIPKLQDALKAKWVEIAPGQGYFDSIVTHERIGRSEMNDALELLLDEKDRNQMKINAWGVYDKATEEQLKGDYNGYLESRVAGMNDTIESLEAKRNAATGEEKERYQRSIDLYTQERDSLEKNTYDKIKEAYGESGKEVAYTTLYNNQYKEKFLNAYTYDRITDIGVDEVSKANREMEMRILEFDEKKRHNAAMELKGSSKDKNNDGIDDSTQNLGQSWKQGEHVKTDTDYSKSAAFDNHQTYVEGLAMDVQKSFEDAGVKAPNLALRSKELIAQLQTGLAGKKTITIGGKTIPLTQDLRNKLLTYKEEFIDIPPAKKEAFQGVASMLEDARKMVAEGLKNGDTTTSNIPNFNIRMAKNEKGQWTVEKFDNSKGNMYSYLTKKGATTEEGKKNLELYSALHLLQDPTLKPAQASLIKEYISRDLLKDVDAKGYSTVNLRVQNAKGYKMPNTTTVVPNAADLWMTEYTKGDVEGNILTSTVDSGLQDFGIDLNLSSGVVKASSQTQMGRLWNSGKKQGVDRVLEDGFKVIGETLEKNYQGAYNLPEKYTYYLEKEDDEEKYKTALRLIGADPALTKGTVKMTPVFKNGVPTTDVELEVNIGTAAKPNIVPKRLTAAEMERSGLGKIDISRNNKYDARNTTLAKTVDLGNGIYEGSPAGISTSMKEGALEYALSINENAVANTKRLFDDYEKGRLQFKLEPQNNQYIYTVYRDGKKSADGFAIPLGTTVDPHKVSTLLDDPKETTDAIFARYLDHFQEYMYNQSLNQ